MSGKEKTDFLIIGAGIAGIAAAEAIRDVDTIKGITVVNGEDVPPYCRPLIIEMLTGEKTFEEISLRDAEWYAKKKISLINGDRVVKIDSKAKSVTLESARGIEYEKLLIATGSRPAVPPIPGLDEVPVYNLFRKNDIENLKPHCVPGAKGLVLGIGLIGLQAITALKKLSVDVTAVEMVDKALPLILDKDGAAIAQKRLEDNGIDIRIGTAVTEFKAGMDGSHTAATDKGDEIGFHFAVLATGMRPDVPFLEGTGIDFGQGVKVSRNMETSVEGIFAAGDIVEYPDWIEGSSELHAHWVNAYRQGRVAGLSMAGASKETYEPIYLNSLNVFGLPIITMGASRIDDPADAEVFVSEIPERDAYTRFVVKGGRLIAATFINDVDRAGVLQYVMREKVDIGEVSHSLFEEGKEGLEFLYKLHNDIIRGDLEWPPSMDLIDKYRKDMKRTRWGGDK